LFLFSWKERGLKNFHSINFSVCLIPPKIGGTLVALSTGNLDGQAKRTSHIVACGYWHQYHKTLLSLSLTIKNISMTVSWSSVSSFRLVYYLGISMGLYRKTLWVSKFTGNWQNLKKASVFWVEQAHKLEQTNTLAYHVVRPYITNLWRF